MLTRNYSSIRLEITSQCNINCLYCHNYEYNNKNTDMSTKEILSLIEQLKKKYPIDKVLITGGEPLLQKDLIQIIKRITTLGIKCDMVTNGKLLDQQKILELIDAGLKRIRISIDGFDEHIKFRKGSDPYKLWELCKFISTDGRLDLCVHTVCSSHNINNLYKIYTKLLEVGANRWRVFDIGYNGAFLENMNYFDFDNYYTELVMQSKQILQEFISKDRLGKIDIEINGVFKTNLLQLDYEKYKNIDINSKLKELISLSPCDYISHQLTIRSNGIGTLCQYFHEPIFDFKKYKYDVCNSTKNRIYQPENELLLKDIDYCKNCKYILICNSGCRSRAKFLTNNLKQPDPVACVILPLLYREIIPILPTSVQNTFLKLLNNDTKPKYNAKDLYDFMAKKNLLSYEEVN